jgi:fructose-1,6-bisphosphatase/inositol monophosphatase family enzyme
VKLAPWDFAALEPIVIEAGGRLAEFRGQTVSTNGLVHDEVLAALSA